MVTPHQVQLEYSVTAATNVAPATLSTAMAAVALYSSTTQDPLLGQTMGLTVANDTMSTLGSVVTRTIVLNMDPAAGAPNAPPFFTVHAQSIDETVALYSTSPQDGPGGVGALTVSVTYNDAEGNTGTVSVTLDGKTPVPIVPAAGTKGVASITDMHILTTGSLGNSLGQITAAVFVQPKVEPPEAEPPPLSQQDAYQNGLGDKLAYIPPSYYSYATAGAGEGFSFTTLTAMVTDIFTHKLSQALSTPVTAAAPTLIP
jgi:hypothetical protein